LRLSLEPDAEIALLELCPGCARTLARLLNAVELRREGAGIRAQTLAPSRRRRDRRARALARPLLLVLRAISYLAIVALAFAIVTWLTSLR
jgi:hypothetical protein